MLIPPGINEEKIPRLRHASRLNEWESPRQRHDIITKNPGNDEWKAICLPRQGYFATPIIIYINVLVFLIMVLSGMGVVSFKAEDLLRIGANHGPAVAEGEWWRLLTSIFIHGGLMHIFANMYALLFVGIFLEPALGTPRFATAYLLTGILSSCASIWWHPATVSIGASGAIFGLYGVLWILILTKTLARDFSKALLPSVALFTCLNLLMGFAMPGVDNAGHIGGLLAGIIVGLIYWRLMQRKRGGTNCMN